MSYECNQPITINLNYFTTTTKIASGVNLIPAYIFVIFFFFADFKQLHKHTYMHQNPRLCKYPHKHNDLFLKRE